MTLPFCEEVVNDYEINKGSFRNPNFVGYLNPNGKPIDYSSPFGIGGHDNNSTTCLFEKFFYIKYTKYISNINDTFNPVFYRDEEQEKERERKKCKQQLIYIDDKLKSITENIKSDLKIGISPNKFKLMKRDLLLFFKNCYLNGDFAQGFGKDIILMNRAEFNDKIFNSIRQEISRLYSSKGGIPRYPNFEFQYEHYRKLELLDLLKEVFICYLGYHSVERTPKTITTSASNIYETFYNYLLNDFTIYQMPKMIFDSSKNTYIQYNHNEFLVADSELRLKDEIQAIKRRVPIKERSRYYR